METGKKVRRWARRMKRHLRVAAEIVVHPRTPWYARAAAAVVLAYALSPIDLVPDFIPVVGYLDDLLLVPLGIFLVIRLTPREVRVQAARRAIRAGATPARKGRWVAAAIVVAVWITALVFLLRRILAR